MLGSLGSGLVRAKVLEIVAPILPCLFVLTFNFDVSGSAGIAILYWFLQVFRAGLRYLDPHHELTIDRYLEARSSIALWHCWVFDLLQTGRSHGGTCPISRPGWFQKYYYTIDFENEHVLVANTILFETKNPWHHDILAFKHRSVSSPLPLRSCHWNASHLPQRALMAKILQDFEVRNPGFAQDSLLVSTQTGWFEPHTE